MLNKTWLVCANGKRCSVWDSLGHVDLAPRRYEIQLILLSMYGMLNNTHPVEARFEE